MLTLDLSGKPLTREYAQRRMANEPMAEIVQTKGQSDTDPALSPNDEFADFEVWKFLLDGSKHAKSATGSYIRQAYGVGQELQEKLGANPFKYGIEAGSDFTPASTRPRRATTPARTATRTTIREKLFWRRSLSAVNRRPR